MTNYDEGESFNEPGTLVSSRATSRGILATYRRHGDFSDGQLEHVTILFSEGPCRDRKETSRPGK